MLNRSGRITPGHPINDQNLWDRDDFGPDRKWVKAIPNSLIDDIDKGLERLRDADLHPKAVRPNHLPLPNARAFIDEIPQAIEAGPGFVLLSRFPTGRYSESGVKLAYSGLMSHFGEYVVDVSDKGRGLGPQARGHYGNKELPFHADGGNAVSLLCLKTAPKGGQSLLVSGAKIYNAVVNERRDLLPVLERGFHYHQRDERDPEDPTYTPWRTPVFGYYDDRFHIIYVRPSIDYCIAEGVEITAEECAAMDFVDSVIARPDTQVSMALEPSDLQIVNNFLVLHSRTAFEDESDHARHLVRLWLDNPNSLHNGPGKMEWYMPEHSRFLKTRGALLEG